MTSAASSEGSSRLSGDSRHPAWGLTWTQAHGLLILGATIPAVVWNWPALPTLVGLISLSVLLLRHRSAWTPSGRFGLANSVTTLRLLLTAVLISCMGQSSGYTLASIALTILFLDAADGWLARRFGGAGTFGGHYDMESDALFVLALSAVLFWRGVAGGWVLLAGLWRYLFVVVPLVVPSRGGEAPRSLLYRSAYSVMVASFLLALIAPARFSQLLAGLGTLVLSASFLRSFWYRYLPPSTT